MKICKNKTKVTTLPKLISGNLYYRAETQGMYIYCEGKNVFVNLDKGSFYPNDKIFQKGITDVTDKYCLKEI